MPLPFPYVPSHLPARMASTRAEALARTERHAVYLVRCNPWLITCIQSTPDASAAHEQNIPGHATDPTSSHARCMLCPMMLPCMEPPCHEPGGGGAHLREMSVATCAQACRSLDIPSTTHWWCYNQFSSLCTHVGSASSRWVHPFTLGFHVMPGCAMNWIACCAYTVMIPCTLRHMRLQGQLLLRSRQHQQRHPRK